MNNKNGRRSIRYILAAGGCLFLLLTGVLRHPAAAAEGLGGESDFWMLQEAGFWAESGSTESLEDLEDSAGLENQGRLDGSENSGSLDDPESTGGLGDLESSENLKSLENNTESTVSSEAVGREAQEAGEVWITGQEAENQPENLSETISEIMPETMPETVPETMPETMTESLSESHSEGLPETLPESKQEQAVLTAAVQMCGDAPDADGKWYYRGENCGIRIVLREGNERIPASELGKRFHFYFDGEDRTSRCSVSEGGDGTLVCTYPAGLVSELFKKDGLHEIKVDAVSISGEELKKLSTGSDEVFADPICKGIHVEGCRALFVLDRKSPVFRVDIRAPRASRQEALERGDRYYFNSSFSVHVSVEDENLDLSSVRLRRGSVQGGSYNGEEVQIAAFPEIAAEGNSQLVHEVTEDGVYRYEVSGWDKAGNPFVPAKGAEADAFGRTRHIVLEQQKPTGTLWILAGDNPVCEMKSGGSGKVENAFLSVEEAEVRIEADAAVRLPVSISCELEASPKLKKTQYKTSSYAFGDSLRLAVKGGRRFRVKRWTITDLAGNSCSAVMKDTVSLDPDSPKLTLTASGSTGRTTDSGLPIYRGDVRLYISAEDPGTKKGGSGIRAVTVRVSANGASGSDTLFSETGPEGRGSWSGEYTVSSSAYEGNDILFEAVVTDAAGNTASTQYRFAIDVTPPSVKLFFGEEKAVNELYFNEPRTARLEVSDRNFDPEAVFISVGENVGQGESREGEAEAQQGETQERAGAPRSGNWSRKQDGAGGDVYVQELSFEKDGEYHLSFEVTDRAGNASSSASSSGDAPVHFIIDTTAPVFQVREGGGALKKGVYFPAARSFEVTAKDEHYADEGKLFIKCGERTEEIPFLNGKAEIETEEEGHYEISGTAVDLAGNEAVMDLIPDYVIDRTPPFIWVEGVSDGSANKEELYPVVGIEDENLGEDCLTVSLQKDGEEERSFSLKPPEEELPAISEDGLYRLAAVGRDLAGNVTTQSLKFSENRSGTVFEWEQEELAGKWTNQVVQPSFVLHDVNDVSVVSCKINGEAKEYDFSDGRLLFQEEIAEDGIYRIEIEAVDEAGHHTAMEPVELQVDRTAPVLTLSGLSPSKQYYFEPLELLLESDDPEAEFSELVFDGKVLSPSSCEKRGSALVLPVQSFGEHTISAVLTDPAGNKSERVARSFVISSNPWLRLTANPLLIILLLAAAGGGTALLIYSLKKNKLDEPPSTDI